MQILPPRKPSYRAAFYADWRWWMSLEKPATVVADPVESAKRNELTAGRARSSQRVRGAERLRALDDLLEGNIPACAGSSRSARHQCGGRRDHPRACGEQELPFAALVLLTGSSPRVRGAGAEARHLLHVLGIIPARAGNMAPTWSRARFTRDHPRVCGEQGDGNTPGPTHPGSSLRVRGTANGRDQAEAMPGIIPACAGSRAPLRDGRRTCRDHPRMCGGQPSSSLAKFLVVGSSPRVRGAVVGALTLLTCAGIIPAHAGSRVSVT